MAQYTEHTTSDGVAERDVIRTEQPVVVAPPVVADVARPRRGRGFVAGFVVAVLVVAAAIAVFFVVSDSDDDGNVNVDVPSVQVDENP